MMSDISDGTYLNMLPLYLYFISFLLFVW